MIKPPPDILEFAEYRKYLKERYRFLKLNDRKFSHRYINGKVGLKSSGWFADVLAGRQRLKPAHVRSVAAAFKLNPEEQKCLHALVDLEVAATPEDISSAYERWALIKGIGRETIGKDRIRIYERWYFTAFRELMALKPGLRDPETLAASLDPRITAAQAKAAMELLISLGLVRDGSDGGASIPMPVLVKDPAVRTRHWKRMMASMMRLGRRALDKYGRDERNFSALTLTFSPEGLKKAGEEITALRKRLLYLSEKDKGSDRVYNCLFQIYPVSNPMEASRV
jgi:uncharacterized protein (TIGR02147 family)